MKNLNDLLLSEESFTYDAAGNLTDAPDSCFGYDTNNRLVVFNGNSVSYDMDGNMLSNGSLSCAYDSANRLVSAGGHTYTYNAEDVRIRNLCGEYDTTYVYDTNCKLSQLLCKTTNDITTKYVYGLGLIGEEKQGGAFKTYHFDSRGSTVAITDISGNITDTFAYDTYGKCISHIGNSFVIFGYNGRDGVITDKNGLLYMRARYYSPDMRRFVNADIVSGNISNAVTLNRYAYANGNPVSFVDPFGLWSLKGAWNSITNWVSDTANDVKDWFVDTANQLLDVYKQKVDLEAELQQAQFEMVKDTGEWLNKHALNSDGSYSLHDNLRRKRIKEGETVFHEQILAVTPSGPSFDLRTKNFGLGSLEIDAMTGGWEGKYADLSLFDVGHAEIGAEIKNGDVRFGALASVWSPSFSFSIGKLSISIGAEVVAIGAGFKKVKNKVTVYGALGAGASLTFSLND